MLGSRTLILVLRTVFFTLGVVLLCSFLVHGDYTITHSLCAQNTATCSSCLCEVWTGIGTTDKWCYKYFCDVQDLYWTECVDGGKNFGPCCQNSQISHSALVCSGCKYRVCDKSSVCDCQDTTGGDPNCATCPFLGGSAWTDSGYYYQCYAPSGAPPTCKQ
jgi:hypothetical protein